MSDRDTDETIYADLLIKYRALERKYVKDVERIESKERELEERIQIVESTLYSLASHVNNLITTCSSLAEHVGENNAKVATLFNKVAGILEKVVNK